MQAEPQIIVSYSVRSDAGHHTIGVIQVTGLPTDGIYIKPPRKPISFRLINETKPFSHLGQSVDGGIVYDLTVPADVPLGRDGLEVGGLFCWSVREFDAPASDARPCLGQDLRCRFALQTTSVYPLDIDPEQEAEDRKTGDYERRSADRLSLTTPYPVELECDDAEGYGVMLLYSLAPDGSGTGLLRFAHGPDWPAHPRTIKMHRFRRFIGTATVTPSAT